MTHRLLLALFAALVPIAPLASEPVPPTHTLSGQTEPAERTRVIGPGWVCFEDYGIALAAGETAYAAYIGLHSTGWRVVGPRGHIVVTESEAFAVPEEPGQAMPDARGRHIVRYGAPGASRYMIWGVIGSAGPEQRPVVRVEGPGLTGSGTGETSLNRIELRPRPASCRFRILRIEQEGEVR